MDNIDSYKFQKSQVQEALQSDPNNEELLKLSADLDSVIGLYDSLAALPVEEVTLKPVKPRTKEWAVGQIVLAKFTDGNYYEAKVVGKKGGEYHVTFTGYNEIEKLHPIDLRDSIVANSANTRKEMNTEVIVKDVKPVEKMLLNKPKKKRTKAEYLEKKNVEHKEKQNAWLSFATAGTSKKTAPLKRTSIFATSEALDARVGFTGSGKPMTQFGTHRKYVPQKDLPGPE